MTEAMDRLVAQLEAVSAGDRAGLDGLLNRSLPELRAALDPAELDDARAAAVAVRAAVAKGWDASALVPLLPPVLEAAMDRFDRAVAALSPDDSVFALAGLEDHVAELLLLLQTCAEHGIDVTRFHGWLLRHLEHPVLSRVVAEALVASMAATEDWDGIEMLSRGFTPQVGEVCRAALAGRPPAGDDE